MGGLSSVPGNRKKHGQSFPENNERLSHMRCVFNDSEIVQCNHKHGSKRFEKPNGI